MSSGGQIVGAIGGAVAGFILSAGNPLGAIKGAAYGAAIGGYIDPPPGPNLRGPTLEDKSFQSAAYGVSIPRLYGTIATMGNIIYLENNEYKAVSKKESQGGKGGGGGTYETTTYFATFAVALAEAMPGSAIRRLWAGGKLIYSAGTDDLGTILQSQQGAAGWKYYDGTQTEPDARMEAVLGVGICPSYEGTAYIIFNDFELTGYGNGLAGCPIKAEIVCISSAQVDQDQVYDNFLVERNFHSVSVPFVSTRKTIQAMTLDGVFTSSRYFEDLKSAEVKNLSINGVRHTGYVEIGNGEDYSILASLRGVSDDAAFAAVKVFYTGTYPDNVLNHEIITDAGSFSWPFIRRGGEYNNYVEADAIAYYSAQGMGAYILAVGRGVPGSPYADGELFLWGGGGVIAVSEAGDAQRVVAVGEGVIALVGGDVVDGAQPINIYRDGLIESSFYLPLPAELSSQTAATINRGKIYLLYRVSVNSGIYGIKVINIARQTVSDIRINVAPISIVSYDFFPTLSVRDGVVCIGFNGPDGSVIFVYGAVATGGDVAGQPLDDVCRDILWARGITGADLSHLEGEYVDGYRTSDATSARADLAPLQTAYLFDFVELGYSLKAVKRSFSQVVEIEYGNLVMDSSSAVIKKSYSSTNLRPSRYSLNYMSFNREYDSAVEYVDYPSSFTNERSESLPLVLSANNAAKLVDTLINLSWQESIFYEVELPQTHIDLIVSDVLKIKGSPLGDIYIRCNAVEKSAAQAVKVKGFSCRSNAYCSSAVGSEFPSPSEVIPLLSNTVSALMDIPMVVYDMDSFGFVWAAVGGDAWPGAVLMESTDSGQTYRGIRSANGNSTMAQALNVLAESDAAVIDRVSTLLIQPIYGDFFSLTESQMMTGKNYLAYGRDGRWEIMQYATAAPVGGGGLSLGTLVRGRFGTEWATGLHQLDDFVVLLDDPDNVFVSVDPAALGVNRKYKSVTLGQSVGSVNSVDFTYSAANLRPLSPVNFNAVKSGGDWLIEWSQRTRYSGSEWSTGIPAMLEWPQNFVVEILKLGAVVRVINSVVTSVIYSEAQQIVDFGAPQNTITFRIYQLSARVGQGYALEVTV